MEDLGLRIVCTAANEGVCEELCILCCVICIFSTFAPLGYVMLTWKLTRMLTCCLGC